jgi:hypothetical protein
MTDTTQAAIVMTDPSPAADLSAAIDVPTLESLSAKANELLAEIDASELHAGVSKALTGARAQIVTALLFVETHFRQLEVKAADPFASAETAVKDEVAKVETAPDAAAATTAAQ